MRRLLRPGPLHRCVALQAGHQLLINLFEPLPEPLNFLFGLVILPAQRGKGRIPLNDTGDRLGLDSWAAAKRVGWCAMSRGGEPWRGLLII